MNENIFKTTIFEPDFVLPPWRGHEGGEVAREDLLARRDPPQRPHHDPTVQRQVEARVREATVEFTISD